MEPKYKNGGNISFNYNGQVVSGNIISNPRNVNGVYKYQVEFMLDGDFNYDDIAETDIKGIV